MTPIQIAASDETTALVTGNKITLRAPFSITNLLGVRASLTTAQVGGSKLTVDVKKNGTSLFSTLLTFDNGSKTTITASVPAVISTTSISDDDEIVVSVTQIGDGTAKGLKVTLLAGGVQSKWVVFDGTTLEVKGGSGAHSVARAPLGPTAGNYIITWDSPFSSATYAANITAIDDNIHYVIGYEPGVGNGARTAATLHINVANPAVGNGQVDATDVMVIAVEGEVGTAPSSINAQWGVFDGRPGTLGMVGGNAAHTITRLGTGHYTITWHQPFATAVYPVSITVADDNTQAVVAYQAGVGGGGRTTTDFSFYVLGLGAGGTTAPVDCSDITVSASL